MDKINDNDIQVDYNWKPALTYLDKKGAYVVYNYESDPFDTNFDIINNINSIEAFVSTFLDLNEVKKRYSADPKPKHTKEQIHSHYADRINVKALLMSHTLEQYGFVTSEPYNKHKCIKLTARGVDVALKLQEHEDNNTKFKSQENINKVLQNNSNKTVKIAITGAIFTFVALCISAYKVYQFEQKIVSHEDISASISELKKNYNSLVLDNEKLKATIQLFKVSEIESKSITVATSEDIKPTNQVK